MAINIYKKNESRDLVKHILERKNSEEKQRAIQEHTAAARRSQGMEPLLAAYLDLEDQYLRVSVLRAIWPLDFDKRDDAFRNLLLGYVHHDDLICGIRIRTPTGNMTFVTELGPMNEYVYIYTYDSNGLRPQTRQLTNVEDWLNIFYTETAKLIDPFS